VAVPARRRTATSNFGVSKRENHDASGFYGRFGAPVLSDDTTVAPPAPVADGSVALVVTSPPYFAGKRYEEEFEREGVPSSYLEYLQLLRDVFAECARTLEPGGRIAVNVANLGRKPYRSLSADVIRILQDDLGLLLRGEIIWQKGDGASGSCAWGSFRSAANPVLRDITERVVVASKGRFDRAGTVGYRAAEGLPHESTLATDDFLMLTLDVWEIPAESARRVGHPAPFPVELPEQLIRLYTFAGDLVLDPFMGSGSALVAAARLGRRYVGYDLDAEYVEIARRRVADALVAGWTGDHEGASAPKLAEEVLAGAGFSVTARKLRIAGTGVTVSLVAADAAGATWYFDVAGPSTSHRGGLLRSDAVWKCLGRAHALRGRLPAGTPLVVLATHLPPRPGEGDTALRAAGPDAFFDAVDLRSTDGRRRLEGYARGGRAGGRPDLGFWTAADLSRRR
jgi:DNA modification methylase